MLGMRSDFLCKTFFFLASIHGLKGKSHVKPEKILCRYVLLTFDLDHALITHGYHKAHVVTASWPRPWAKKHNS